jgi:hypothetical protein
MTLEIALRGMLDARGMLQQKEAVYTPSYISEQMQRLAQYTSAVEEGLAELEKELKIKETRVYNQHRAEGESSNASNVAVEHETSTEKAEIVKLTRLTSSSWRLIGASQSRIKHLLAEAQNQI